MNLERGVLLKLDWLEDKALAELSAGKVHRHLNLPVCLVSNFKVESKEFDILRLASKGFYYELSPFDETLVLNLNTALNSSSLLSMFDSYATLSLLLTKSKACAGFLFKRRNDIRDWEEALLQTTDLWNFQSALLGVPRYDFSLIPNITVRSMTKALGYAVFAIRHIDSLDPSIETDAFVSSKASIVEGNFYVR